MARKKALVEENGLEMPPYLEEAIDSAKKLIVPTPTQLEEEKIPTLFKWMTPLIVPTPPKSKQGMPGKALREPLLLLAFDRRSGGYKISLSDTVLNIGGSLIVQSLFTALVDLEEALASNTFHWSEKKIT